MSILSTLTLLLSIFANRALCDTTFRRPPEWNSDVDRKAGFGKNVQYRVDDAIQILWETDLDKVELYLIQTIGSTYWEYILDCRMPRSLSFVYDILTRVFSISYRVEG